MSEYHQSNGASGSLTRTAVELMTVPPPTDGPDLMASAEEMVATGRSVRGGREGGRGREALFDLDMPAKVGATGRLEEEGTTWRAGGDRGMERGIAWCMDMHSCVRVEVWISCMGPQCVGVLIKAYFYHLWFTTLAQVHKLGGGRSGPRCHGALAAWHRTPPQRPGRTDGTPAPGHLACCGRQTATIATAATIAATAATVSSTWAPYSRSRHRRQSSEGPDGPRGCATPGFGLLLLLCCSEGWHCSRVLGLH